MIGRTLLRSGSDSLTWSAGEKVRSAAVRIGIGPTDLVRRGRKQEDMSCTRNQMFGRIIGCLMFALAFSHEARGQILVDLTFSPGSHTREVGDIFNVQLRCVSSSPTSSSAIAAIQVILNWNSTKLEFLGITNDGPYSWLSSSLPGTNSLNTSLLDGDAYYEALSRFPPSPIAQATPTPGLHVTTLRFKALATTTSPTLITMPLTQGTNQTLVASGTSAGVDILRVRGTASVTITIDCNNNNVADATDIALGTSQDCNSNTIPDECEIAGPFCSVGCGPDCNSNGIPDACDADCNGNGTPDACEAFVDCQPNGVPDSCDIASGTALDCNGNTIPDSCDIASGTALDCNGNGRPDVCDIASGTDPDCNSNNIPDSCDIAAGTVQDCQPNGIPDLCESDCNGNGIADTCDIALGTSTDCQANGVPDICDIASGTSIDCQFNGVPDECEADCNLNGVADECEIGSGAEDDCQPNGVPDSCEISSASSDDCNGNGIPDECDGGGSCFATRDLTQPRVGYCQGLVKTVRIALNIPPGTFAIGLEDSPPAGWTLISNVSNSGGYDAINDKVKWGPFFAPFPAEVSYDVMVPVSATGQHCFCGQISINGINSLFCNAGDRCVDESCFPQLPADDVQPGCSPCVGCGCGASSCQDGRVELCEVIGYACSWRTGCNDDLAGMVRAAFLYQGGECYCFDDTISNWSPNGSCPSPATGACSSPAPASAGLMGEVGEGLNASFAELRTVRRGRYDKRSLASIPIMVEPPAGTLATAFEFHVPEGWVFLSASDGGVWDSVNRKAKWGLYFDDLPRTVYLRAAGVSQDSSLEGFAGRASFDGIVTPIEIE